MSFPKGSYAQSYKLEQYHYWGEGKEEGWGQVGVDYLMPAGDFTAGNVQAKDFLNCVSGPWPSQFISLSLKPWITTGSAKDK